MVNVDQGKEKRKDHMAIQTEEIADKTEKKKKKKQRAESVTHSEHIESMQATPQGQEELSVNMANKNKSKSKQPQESKEEATGEAPMKAKKKKNKNHEEEDTELQNTSVASSSSKHTQALSVVKSNDHASKRSLEPEPHTIEETSSATPNKKKKVNHTTLIGVPEEVQTFRKAKGIYVEGEADQVFAPIQAFSSSIYSKVQQRKIN